MQQHNFASSNKSKGASLSSDEEVYEISQTHLRKKANKEDDTTQSPKLQLSKSKDAFLSLKEKECPLKKNVEKKFVISKSSKLQASKMSKNASSSSNKVYSISESPLRRKTNKQIVPTSSDDEESILLQSLKRNTPKKTKFNNRSSAKENKYKNLFKQIIFGVLLA